MSPLSRIAAAGALACAAALALPLAQARELVPIDALGSAPLAIQPKAAALPENVQSLSREERLGLPTFVQLRPSSLAKAGAAPASPADAARAQLKALAPLYGVTPQEVDAAPLHHVQTLPGGASLVRLTNQRDGIEVFRDQATVLLNAQSQATAIGGYLGSTAPAPALKAAPATGLGAADAVARALQDYGFDAGVALQLQMAAPPTPGDTGPYQWWALPAGVSGAEGATLLQPARLKPVWFRLPQGLVGAYYVELRVREDGEEHAYAYVVAADDGRLLLRHNQTAHQHGYRAFADPMPPYTPWPGAQGSNGKPHPTGTPDGYAPPLAAANLVNLSNAPFSRNDPWLPAGATQTQGNNVHAYADLAAPDGWNAGDLVATTTAPGVFDYTYNHGQTPLADGNQVAASVVNLFYATNWLHDWFYDAGFNEAAGNAQADNFGRGGLGGDAMHAQALDYDGTNNANMSTPADGAPPRMQMYRFVNAQPPQAGVTAPPDVAGSYGAMGAAFGAQVFDLTQEVVAASPADGCTVIANGAALVGKIALVDRGGCEFSLKALNAQNAGAAAVVVVNNSPDAFIRMGAGASGASVTIAAIHVTQATGTAWRNASGPVTLRMQGTGASTERSSALDNTIIAHEWGHFISNRLIGDASGLVSNHARGLGEGWGDFHSLLMMVSDVDRLQPGNSNFQGVYATGAYALGSVEPPALDATNAAYYGIRRYPYSTDLTKNPLTLQHITDGVALPATAPRNPAASGANAEVHNTGEVWASMLWECYASLLNAHPFQGAQDRMKGYLVAGYKLTPVNPTLTEARDALLAAAGANDPADYQRCAAVFAKRGAGAFAQVPDRYSATNAGVVESFSTDGALVIEGLQLSMITAPAQRCDADGVLDSGETGGLTITLRNQGFQPVSGAQLTLSAGVAGVQFPDGVLAVPPVGAAGATVTVKARVQLAGLTAPGGTRITASLTHAGQLAGAVTGTLDMPLHHDELPARLASDDAEALVSAMAFGSSVAGQEGAWAVKRYGVLDHRYAGSTPAAIGSHWMRTPALQVAATGDFIVSFKHRYRFEQSSGTNWDGGQLMISTDGGTTWASVAAAGYNGTVDGASGNPAQGQQAYVGQSAGWPAMAPATVNLGTAYAGQSVRLAWVVHTDPEVGTEGWEVDDIVFTGITNTPFPRVVPDAQVCAPGLVATDGTPQSAAAGTAFGWPLKVTLRGAGGAPQAGQTVTFTAPAAGASATLASATVVTDANGDASVPAAANGTVGGYTVTADAGGYTASFTLTNTAALAGALGAVSGTPQSTPVGAAFAQPLRVRLLDAGNAPMAGVAVGFMAPASGASATLTSSTVVTDANGEASVAVTANGTQGSYNVTATALGRSTSFALRNTAAPVGTGGGGGGPLSISGPSPNGQGPVTATVQSATTPLTAQAYFSQAQFASEAGVGAPAMPGYRFPYGLVGFALENVGLGNAVTLRIQYPGPVPSGAEYWKYGRTTPAGAPHWHQIPMTLVGGAGTDTIEITLADGGLGDSDARPDGTITDPGGLRVLAAPLPGPGGAAAIPALSPIALALLAAGLGLLGWRRRFMR